MYYIAALQWLKENNPCYKDITIDMTSIANQPVDGVPAELLSIHEDDDDDEVQSTHDTADDLTNDTHWFLPFPVTETILKTRLFAQPSMVTITLNGQTLTKHL